MRLILALIAVEIGCTSMALSEEPLPLADRLFCDYVADFAPQIARNRIREVPFLRLDEFAYFEGRRSKFLRRTAQEIYAQPPAVLRSALDGLADDYVKECQDAFDQG